MIVEIDFEILPLLSGKEGHAKGDAGFASDVAETGSGGVRGWIARPVRLARHDISERAKAGTDE